MNYEDFAMDVNQVMLIGTVKDEPELKYTKNNTALLKFRLITTKSYNARNGEVKPSRASHSVTIWGERGQRFADIISEGSRVVLMGELKNNSYQDRQGQTRWVTEVHANVFRCLDQGSPDQIASPPQTQQPKQAYGQRPAPAQAPPAQPAAPPPQQTPGTYPQVPEDDLPF